MAELISNPCYLSDCKKITIPTSESVLVQLYAGVPVEATPPAGGVVIEDNYKTRTGTLLFNEELFPIDDKVIIYNLDKIMKPYILLGYKSKDSSTSYSPVVFTLYLNDEVNVSFKCFYDLVNLGDVSFCTFRNTRNLYLNNSEEMCYFKDLMPGDSIVVTTKFYLNGVITTSTPTLYSNTSDGVYTNLLHTNISPQRVWGWVNKNELISYSIHRNSDHYRDVIDVNILNQSDDVITFKYRNFFGCFDIIQVPGFLVNSPETTRQTAIIDNLITEYNNNIQQHYSLESGIMLSDNKQAMLELSLSPDVSFLNPSTGSYEDIIFTKFENETSTDSRLPLQYNLEFSSKKSNFYE